MSTAHHDKLDGIANNANNYSHPNHTGDVTSVGDGALTISDDAVTFAKIQNISQNKFAGRISSGTGNLEQLTAANVRSIINVEDGATADQTASEIKSLLQSDKLTVSEIADDAITADKLANSINTEIAANTAKTSNANHTGEVTGSTSLTIADNVVDEANLKVSNSPTNGYVLTAQSGATGGLTWAEQSSGSSVGGATGVDFNDGVKARFGTNNDLEIFHDNGENRSFLKNVTAGQYFEISSAGGMILKSGSDNILFAAQNGKTSLYFDGSEKIETYSEGVLIDDNVLKFGNITVSSDQPNVNTGNPCMLWAFDDELNIAGYDKIKFIESGFVRWEVFQGALRPHGTSTYYDLGTSSNRIGDIFLKYSVDLPDDGEIRLGDGDDFKLYHDGVENFIHGGGFDTKFLTNGTETGFKVRNNAACHFYYDNSSKFYTESFGATFQGSIRPNANNSYDLGSSSLRWANVYTNDLHLSNKDSSNEMDGTWGDWTIQEGESDLFLKNNRSGKKYKFNLTEVS